MLKKKRNISERTFYRTVIQVEVLSEDPFEFRNLRDVFHAITTGDCYGEVSTKVDNQRVNGRKMADLLISQGSDPSLFMLDGKGRDLVEVD